MKKQRGYMDGIGTLLVVMCIAAGLVGYGALRGVEWVVTNISFEVKKK